MDLLNPNESPLIGNKWEYESDGEEEAKTYYIYRDNESAPLGSERLNFTTRTKAIKAQSILNSCTYTDKDLRKLNQLIKECN